MAMEQYFQQLPVPETNSDKQEEATLEKWKSLSDGSDAGLSAGFDCNICLDTVHEPVVTLCGHLYCWPCIYKWIHQQKTSPEFPDKQNQKCPVCKAEVSEKTIVPLYGRGYATPSSEGKAHPDLGLAIPQRPNSPRFGVVNTRTAPHSGGYRQRAPPPIAMPAGVGGGGGGGMATTNLISATTPTTLMFGDLVYGRIFGNSEMTLYTHPNSYNLAAVSTRRTRRQAMQADSALKRLFFFLLCCFVVCLFLF